MTDNQSQWTPLKKATAIVAGLALLIALVAVWIVVWRLPGTTPDQAMERLKIVIGYEILVLIFFFGLMVLLYMGFGEIDLSKLLCEPKGRSECAASMSRFQLLIFTFVISLSLFLIIVAAKPEPVFPAIPSEILLLLGISASTYAVGKGIQAGGNGGGGAGPAAPQAAQNATEAARDAAAAADGAGNAAQGAAATARGSAAVHRAAADAHGAAAKAHAAAAAAQGTAGSAEGAAAHRSAADAHGAAADAHAAAAEADDAAKAP